MTIMILLLLLIMVIMIMTSMITIVTTQTTAIIITMSLPLSNDQSRSLFMNNTITEIIKRTIRAHKNLQCRLMTTINYDICNKKEAKNTKS